MTETYDEGYERVYALLDQFESAQLLHHGATTSFRDYQMIWDITDADAPTHDVELERPFARCVIVGCVRVQTLVSFPPELPKHEYFADPVDISREPAPIDATPTHNTSTDSLGPHDLPRLDHVVWSDESLQGGLATVILTQERDLSEHYSDLHGHHCYRAFIGAGDLVIELIFHDVHVEYLPRNAVIPGKSVTIQLSEPRDYRNRNLGVWITGSHRGWVKRPRSKFASTFGRTPVEVNANDLRQTRRLKGLHVSLRRLRANDFPLFEDALDSLDDFHTWRAALPFQASRRPARPVNLSADYQIRNSYFHLEADERGAAYVILDRHGRSALGAVFLSAVDHETESVSIDFCWLAPRIRGTAASAELALLLLKMCFEDDDCRRVDWSVPATDTASAHELNSYGFQSVGTVRSHHRAYDGRWYDASLLSILDDDWLAAKRRLKARISERRDLARNVATTLRRHKPQTRRRGRACGSIGSKSSTSAITPRPSLSSRPGLTCSSAPTARARPTSSKPSGTSAPWRAIASPATCR